MPKNEEIMAGQAEQEETGDGSNLPAPYESMAPAVGGAFDVETYEAMPWAQLIQPNSKVVTESGAKAGNFWIPEYDIEAESLYLQPLGARTNRAYRDDDVLLCFSNDGVTGSYDEESEYQAELPDDWPVPSGTCAACPAEEKCVKSLAMRILLKSVKKVVKDAKGNPTGEAVEVEINEPYNYGFSLTRQHIASRIIRRSRRAVNNNDVDEVGNPNVFVTLHSPELKTKQNRRWFVEKATFDLE